MTTSYWRQLGAWATKSKDDPFTRSRFNITLIILVSTIFILPIGSFVLGGKMPIGPSLLLIIISTLSGFALSDIALRPLRHIVRAQKRFIADASHELRTPLSIIKADSEITLIDGQAITAEDAITTLKSNLEEVDRMSKIIDNLLSLSFYENKIIRMPVAEIDLNEIAKDITQRSTSVALKKHVRLTAEQGHSAIILGNMTAIEQMTMNLVRNAIFYTPGGGSIKVSVKKLSPPERVELTVQDTGIGISPQDLPNIFNPFYRADARNRVSSGLGLTIVKKIVDRHNGFISVKSELGKGTQVTVILPTV